MGLLGKLSFKDQAFRLREDAILDATTRILSGKGFDLMTMDDVANAVGISKPSLYKHFKSKDDLVGEAMVRLIDGALAFLADMPADLSAKQKLAALLEWALRVRLEGGMPFLPSTSPQVREMLMKNLKYVMRVMKLNGQIEKFITSAQKAGDLNPALPVDVILFSYYSRTCDPAVEFLQLYSKLGTDDIVTHMLHVCFEGLQA
ncbi:TetR/AcrR family transcriptional regulator [Leeia oryzae]|uniref:TetR/AcrR family transcriptional regulator n=1 Tax=Leeia oryzae TaxID=356662 RepID=UPI00037C8C7A|nr:TetR/AcrR family transcriptional regulator [Leeia oryzae]